MTFFLDFVIAFIVSSVIIPIVLRYARSHRLFDGLDERKIHKGYIPRLGGIGIFYGFLIALLSTILLVGDRQGVPFPQPRFWVLFCAGVGFHLLGLVDDLKNLPGRLKIVVQFVLAILVVAAGYYFRSVSLPGILGPVDLGPLGPVVSVFWIVGIANAYNLLDGMDGMTGGVAFIALGVWAAFYLKDGSQYLAIILAIGGAGAVLGFLFYNFPPAVIFMGDSGSLLLGFLISILPLLGVSGRTGDTLAAASVTLSLLPILDTLAAILRRWKGKVSFFTADKYHLHHKLLNLGFSNRQVLAYTYGLCALLGAVVLAGAYMDERAGGVLMLVSWGLGVALFLLLHYLKKHDIHIPNSGSGESE